MMITISEAAARCGVTTQAIRERINRKTVRSARDLVTNRVMVDEEDLERKRGGRPKKPKPPKIARRRGRPSKTTTTPTTQQKAAAPCDSTP